MPKVDPLTLDQRRELLQAIEDYIAEQQGETSTFMPIAYSAGRQGIISLLEGAEVGWDELDDARLATVIQQNIDLITSDAAALADEIMNVVAEFVVEGKSPVELESRLRAMFGKVENSWRTIARDQVAKAQAQGRAASYAKEKVERVEITTAPDACGKCTPYNGMVVNVSDSGDRPQYHIQCACMDIPVSERVKDSGEQELDEARSSSEEGDGNSRR